MKKIVINNCFGGFGLSKKGKELYEKLSGECLLEYERFDNKRDNELLVKVVELLGEEADGMYSELKVVEVPDDCYWFINDYDGAETVYWSRSEIYEVD